MNPIQGLEKWLKKEEMEYIVGFTNKPAALLTPHARDIAIALNEGWINRYQQVEMDRTISRLCDAQGKCERIKNTVFPSTYSMYIHYSLLLFICLLPFGLIEFFAMAEIMVVTAISTSFLLIEKMAINLQDPFDNQPTDTPVTAIATSIERDLRQMIKEPILSDGQLNMRGKETFYVM